MTARRKRGLLRDRWLRRKFLVEWFNGVGTQVGLCCLLNTAVILAVQFCSKQQVDGAAALFAGISFLTAVICIAGDAGWCRQRGYLPLLRRVVYRCRQRMRRLRVNSPIIERFIHELLFSRTMEIRYRACTSRSLWTIVEALDRLSCVAERYGLGGGHVFAANQEPILRSLRLLGSLPAEVEDEVALGVLQVWLEAVPEHDPEGWSLVKDIAPEQRRMLHDN